MRCSALTGASLPCMPSPRKPAAAAAAKRSPSPRKASPAKTSAASVEVLGDRVRAARSNVEVARLMAEWVAGASPDALARFGAQLKLAEAMAAQVDLDAGGSAATQYRQLLANVYDRVDRVYGADAVDATQRISGLITRRAAERAKRGWDG